MREAPMCGHNELVPGGCHATGAALRTLRLRQPAVVGSVLVLWPGPVPPAPLVAPALGGQCIQGDVAASFARGSAGLGPTWAITSPAASEPSRPQVTRSSPLVRPCSTPAANWSP